MGASYFEHTVSLGRKPVRDVFENLVREDQAMNGMMYSGGIGMKGMDGFITITPQPVTPTQAKKLMATFESIDEYVEPRKGDRVKVETWDKKRKTHLMFMGTVNRKQGDRFRIEKERPYWDRTSKPEFVLVPKHDVEVERTFPSWVEAIHDKWGPAGCILVKGGKAIFFGYASS
jgi:hypothetical protein